MLALLLCGIVAASPAPVLAKSQKSAKQEQSKDSKKDKKDKKKEVKAGTYTIDDIEFDYSPEVRNDVTGNWKISTIVDSFSFCHCARRSIRLI